MFFQLLHSHEVRNAIDPSRPSLLFMLLLSKGGALLPVRLGLEPLVDQPPKAGGAVGGETSPRFGSLHWNSFVSDASGREYNTSTRAELHNPHCFVKDKVSAFAVVEHPEYPDDAEPPDKIA